VRLSRAWLDPRRVRYPLYGCTGSTTPLRLSASVTKQTLRFSNGFLALRARRPALHPTTVLSCTSETGHRTCAPLSPATSVGSLCVDPLREWHPRDRSRVAVSQVPAFWSFPAPLATSALKSGLPGLTAPGIFRPWAFSSLRRFTPSDASPVLFHTSATYGVQRTQRFERDPRVEGGSSKDMPSKT